MTVAPSPECTQSETFKQQASGVSKEGSIAACDLNLGGNPRCQISNTESISSSFQTQRQDSLNEPGKNLGSSSGHLRGDIGLDHLSSRSSATLSPGPGTESISSSFETQRQDSLNEPSKNLGSSSGHLRGDIGLDHLSSRSSATLSPGPGTEPLNHGCPLPSQKEHVSSQGFPYVDSEQVHDPPDSTVEDSDISEFVLNSGTRLCDTVDDGDKVDEAGDSLDPECKASVEVQFDPEEFNFNIGKQTVLSQ